MKKALMLASVASMIEQFNMDNIKILQNLGYKVEIAANFTDGGTLDEKRLNEFKKELDKKKLRYIDIHFERSPFSTKNLKAYKSLKKLMKNEQYDLVHVHSPVGSVYGRLAARKINATVIYTAHGFHFFAGAPKKNWLLFYPVEKFLSRYTDVLITINKEDYELARKKFHAKKVYLINGVGVSENKFNSKLTEDEKEKLRKELNIKADDFVITYVAELNENKNQKFLIDATNELKKEIPSLKVLLIGKGFKEKEYREYIKNLQLENKIYLLGYRTDIANILSISNMAVSTSIREGLPLNVIEYCLNDLPVVATKNRGHIEIIKDNKNGYLVNLNDLEALKEKILYIYNNYPLEIEKMKKNHFMVEKFLSCNINKEMEKIYKENENLKKQKNKKGSI